MNPPRYCTPDGLRCEPAATGCAPVGGACDDLDLRGDACERCNHLGPCHKLTEDDGRPILYYTAAYADIACPLHAPRPAARARWTRMRASIWQALSSAIGRPVDCDACRSLARRAGQGA